MGTPLHVLLVEDSPDDATFILHELRRGGYEPVFERVDSAMDMQVALDRQDWEIVIADFVMPGFSGLAALELIKQQDLDIPFIIVSGAVGEEAAVTAMKAGAHDYVMKDNLTRLAPVVKRELEEAQIRKAHLHAQDQLRQSEEKYSQRVQQMRRLHATSLEVSAAHNLPELVGATIHHARHLLEVPWAGIFLREAGQLTLYDEHFLPADLPAAHKAALERVAETVAQSGEPHLLNGDPPKRLGADGQSQPVSAILAVPLIWGGEVMGVLPVMDQDRTHPFTRDDLELLSLFADQVSVAIENVRLLGAERKARQQAETLREVAQVISSTLSLEQVLEAVLDQLGRVLSFDSGFILLLEDNLYSIKVWRGYDAYIDPVQLKNFDFDLTTDRTMGEVLVSGQSMLIPDVQADERWQDKEIWRHVRSWLGVPLAVREQVIGLFSLERVSPDSFNDEDLLLAATFAAHAAAAIDNARLFEAEEQRATELIAVRRASLSLTASLDLVAVLNTILESVLNFLPGTQSAHIFLYRTQEDRLHFGAALWADGRRGAPVVDPRPSGLSYSVARTGQSIVVPDTHSHPLFATVEADAHWAGAIVGLPLIIGQRVVGVMNVSYPTPHRFSESELRVLSLLGDQAAIAIQNARLYERAATERRHLGLLYDLGRELVTSLDYNDILSRAVTLTCRALGGLLGEAFLYLPDENRLSLRALFGGDNNPLESQSLSSEVSLPLGVGLAGWVAQHRIPVNAADVTKDERWQYLLGLDQEAHSALVAPILESGRLLGVISLLHSQPAAFSADHLFLLQAICHQVGLALSSAERYVQVQSLVDLLASEQRRLESLLERLPVGVLLLDGNFRIQIANVLGKQVLERFHPPELGDVLSEIGPYSLAELCSRFSEPGFSQDALMVEIVLDGPPRAIIEVNLRPIGAEARQWVLTIREVTQERETQDRVQLQERLATVGQLAAGIAHDFNNIMAAILVYTDLLMGDRNLPKSSRDRLAIIQQQVQRAASLIRQILDFSRRSIMEQSALDLLPFIKELDKLLSRILPETIRLELAYQPGTFLVNADPTRLQQVFMNLALNARDAMPEGGSLHFELSKTSVEPGGKLPHPELTPGEWVRIVVRDSGLGVPAELLPHIFDPFFTTKPVGQGTGLGLAQVYGIIKQHQGQIDVSSQPGEGTQFTIYLPALDSIPGSEIDAEPAVQFDGSGVLVLVVEDDQATREAMQALLESQNFNVITAQNGAEALKVFEQKGEAITLVVTDIVMPMMGGMALYEILLLRWPEVKMLFVTGHPMEAADQAILEKGAVHWLQKPFSVQDFSKAVQALIQ